VSRRPLTAGARPFLFLLVTYVRPLWRWVVLLVVGSWIAAGLAMLAPFLLAPILDIAFGRPIAPGSAGRFDLASLSGWLFGWLGISRVDQPMVAIALLCGAYVAVGMLKSWAEFGNQLVAMRIRIPAALALQRAAFQHVLSLSLGFFTRQRTGELASRLEWDPHTATGGLESVVCTWLTAPVLVLFYGTLLLRTSPKLAAAALVAVLLHAGLTRAIKGRVRQSAAQHGVVYGEIAARIHEALLSIRVVKSIGAEPTEMKRLGRAGQEALGAHLSYSALKHVEEPARGNVNYLIEGSLVLLAAWELLSGRLTAPTFILFLYVGRAVMVPISQLASATTQIAATVGAATRLFALLDERPEVHDGPRTVAQFRDRLRLDRVAFTYGAEPVLEDVTMEIRRGEMVALVGPSGVGKSTLADLILRFYDPTAGAITLDGVDLRELSQVSYRRLFGVVSQEALLFNATVRENIAYGREGLTDAQIVRAAEIANAHDFIRELPRQYDTLVGDRGIRLSGGQRQRVAIARAIVGDPQILVLDEATSFLDAEAERLVQEAIERVTRETTSIVIAHRLATILHADKIVVLGAGGVEAVGRHEELLTTSPTYRRLCQLQFTEMPSLERR
jgi:subfamily B ATP-binding cassette protein MsbA